ncbi:MAG TPA: FMN-binding protein [Steroidobacter sp.]|nr:FMN-binding protein [Steroidobacter sp.]
MRHELLFIPAIVVSAPALADEYLTLQQAQAQIFPGQTLTDSHFVLDDGQISALVKQTGAPIARRQVRVWKVSDGGWFFLDHVIVRGDRIVYAVGLDARGAVQGIEILACLPLYDGIRQPAWRTQFIGKDHGKAQSLDHIKSVSGSTLSSNNITLGVKRMLATHALFLSSGTPG